ncbi:hypothetical protein ARMGADRAFT_1091565 [Armillaria gallica]|uniref:Heterokaryon incompatibility domain-containing protein n=1 Tax=Armillaria gallica TaxID=47427 RepID=A0A2H3D0U5_ARMGA|nr:hypothetical protein ARMGADRAFT_1091565 [Armillaria gallica]
MDKKNHTAMWTLINGYEWPIPILKDVNLNLIHIKMLNLGLEYTYHAWTLQEVGFKRVIAGDTLDGPLHGECNGGKYETELLTRFHKQLQSMHDMAFDVCEVLDEMQKWVSMNPMDKIAGLAFLVKCDTIPPYHESESLKHAWAALVNVMDKRWWVRFFLCAEPGNTGKKWQISWDQVMMKPLPAFSKYCLNVHWDETEDEDWCNAEGVEGLVLGLAVVEEGDQHGVLIVKDKGGIEHRFEITATHMSPIPEDTYMMIDTNGSESSPHCGWVVGRSLSGGKFEKVSMLIISGAEQSKLRGLGITEERQYILI